MKKFRKVLLVFVMLLCAALVASCNNNGHEHNYVEGKCECGETDPNYVPPHVHIFVEGKCECGEIDETYVPPIVGTSLEEVANWIIESYPDNLLIDQGVDPLPTQYQDKDVTITWESSMPNRVDNTGKIVALSFIHEHLYISKGLNKIHFSAFQGKHRKTTCLLRHHFYPAGKCIGTFNKCPF